jgi:hypothetical protein
VNTTLFLSLLLLIPLNTSDKNLIAPFNLAYPELFHASDEISNYINKNLVMEDEQWIYTDNEILKLYLFHHALLPQDDIYMTSPFAYEPFWNVLKDGSVPYIISQNPIDEVFALKADLSHYKQVDKFEIFYIYQFQPE